MRSWLKKIVTSILGIVGLSAAVSAHADYSIERLSLFIYDGTNSYEDRRLPTVVSNLPPGLTVTFNEVIAANQDRTWTWTFRNTNTTALTNLRLTGFVDPDLSAPINTFFNEYGQLLALSAPTGDIAADKWEIGEPGYLIGDLLPRSAQGDLHNQSTLSVANPDDASMALSLPIGTLDPDQTLTVTGTLTATGAVGLLQIDADDNSQVVFQLYARKGLTQPPSATSDYHVALTTGTPSVTVGDPVSYRITIGNNGQDDGDGISLTDTIPAAITNVTWTCNGTGSATCGTVGGSGNNISLTALVPTTGTTTIDVTGTANTAGAVTNTATIAPSGNTVDPVASNNTASVDVTISAPAGAPSSDYHVVLTTSTPNVTVGDSVTYRITIGNNGQDDGDGISLTDTIPAVITNVTWTCSGTGSATCGTARGSGNNISLTALVPITGIITIDVTGTANTAGTATNTVTIAPQGSTVDPVASNNSSSASVTINAPATPQADFQITLTTGTPLVNVGDNVDYQIVVTNKGTADVIGAQIADTIPAAIDNIFWSCAGSNNATCGMPIGGSNSISLTAQIPVNGIITINVTGKASAIGSIINTATVTPPSGVTDPDMSNNTSTVTLTVNGIAPVNNPPQPIPSGSLGMLALLGLLLIGAVTVFVKPARRGLLPAFLLAVFFSLALMSNDAQAQAQAPDNRGTDFWIGFPLNYDGQSTLTLFIASDQDGTATVDIPGLSFHGEVTFIEGVVSSISLPSKAQIMANDQIAKLGIHVTATAPIAVYGLNRKQYSTDAYLALPVPRLGTEYFAMSYGGSFVGSEFLIVGAFDDTQITITPTDNASPRKANEPYQITLQQGETYRLVADGANGDLTGSLIVSDKPVAFFSGHECTYIPSTYQACDFIVEQLPPTSAWGKQFITVPLASRINGDTFRILASEDDTVIYINNSHIVTLQRGQYYEFILKDPSLIESDKPLLLMQYANGGQFDNNSAADPFMMLVTPTGQYLSQYVVSTLAEGIRNNYINIVIPELTVGSFRLDSQPVSATFRTLPGTHYQTAQISVTEGQHSLAASMPFGAYIYGFDDWDSYGYPAGTAMRDLGGGFQPLSCLSGVNARAKPGKVQLTWTDTGANSYGISRADKYEGPYVRIGVTQSRYSTWQDDTGLQADTNYFYQIDELDENGEVQCTSNRTAGYPPEEWTAGKVVNRSPRFTSVPSLDTLIDQEYTYQAQAIDPDGDALTYSLLDAPDGVTITPNGFLIWTPMAAGRFNITLQVADPSGALALQSFELQVRDPNHPPELNIPTVIIADAGSLFTYQVLATDPDGDTLTYSVLSSTTTSKIDAVTGVLTWAVPETATGEYPVKVTVKDPYGALAFQTFLIKVTPHPVPVVTSIPVTSGVRNIPYRYQVVAYDPEGLSISYSFADNASSLIPTGMTIDPVTGLIEWPSPYLGKFTIPVVVRNTYRTTNHNYTLTIDILPVDNHPPQITSYPVTQVRAGSTYSYTISTYDSDGETVTLSLLDGPTGMQLNGNVLTWATTVADIGTHNVQIEARDPRNGVATQTWVLEVIPATVNRAPTIGSIPAMTGTAGATYVYQVSASDPDGDPLTYTLNTAPVGMTISATGRIEWPIPVGTLGSFDVEIEVADNKGAYARQSYSIGVGGTGNRPPTINSTPGLAGTAGSTYVYQISATDPDSDPLTYALLTAPTGMTISATGRIEWPIPAGTTGVFNVEIEVSDGRGGYVQQSYAIAVGSGNTGNRPPRISSVPISTGTTGGSYTYQVNATDPDGDTLIYTLNTAPTDMTISATGHVDWAIPSNTLGDINVEIEVSDGKGGFARQGYTISVAGSGNRAPRITSTPGTSATVGTLYAYQVNATDPDSDPLTFALVKGPSGMTLSTTNRIEWTPASDQNGYHDVAVMVSDGRGGSTTQTWAIYAQLATNQPPSITSQPVYRAKPGEAYQYNVVATDPNNDPLTYNLVEGPTGMTMPQQGLVSWPNPITGSYTVTIKVSDTHGASTTQSYTLQVGANSPPEINSTAPTSAAVGVLYSYQVIATDPDGDFLTYQLVTHPSGMTINSTTGRIEWTPTNTGNNNVTVRVSDGQATTDQSYTLVVSATPPINTPPSINSTPVTIGVEGTAYSYQVEATDADGDTLAYSLSGAPTGMSIDSSTGLITWSTPVVGTYNIIVHVSDGKATTDQNYTLTVSAAPPINTPPDITSDPVTTGTEGTAYSYQIIATDAEHDSLTYSITSAPTGMSVSSSGLIAWPSPVAGTYNITVHVSDGKATTNQNYTLTIESAEPPPMLLILTPTNGTTINDSVATISGVITYSPGIAVIANGQEAQINEDGSYTIYNVPLQPGSNTIDVVLNTQEHDPVTQEITVTSTANPPISVNVSPVKGLAPMDTTLSILSQQGNSLGNYCLALGYSKDSGAMQDIFALEDASKRVFTTDQASFNFTFPDVGTYTVYTQLQSQSQAGQCGAAFYTTTRTLTVISPAQAIEDVLNVYFAMTNYLKLGKPDKALNYFTSDARARYQRVFNDLQDDLPSLADQLSTSQQTIISGDIVELQVITEINGEQQITPVYMLRGTDGVWRIDSM